MFALKIRGAGYIFPKKFPFVIGKNGDIPANVPFFIKFDIEKGKLVASSDGIFTINNSQSSISVLKPGDVINFCGIELKVEKKLTGYIKNFSLFILSGFLIAWLSSHLLGKAVLNKERKTSESGSNCSVIVQEMEYKARMDLKLLPSTIRFLERCASSLDEKDIHRRDELIKGIGALKTVQDEEFRKLKFMAETAIRNGDIASALKNLQQIKEIIDDPSDNRWRYAFYRMRELAE